MQNNPYQSLLNLKDTEKAIKIVKDTFEMHLAKNLHLLRVSAPLLVHPSTGLNDDLNGVERPVIFDVKEDEAPVSVVQSLAKWKRYALKRYQFKMHQGLYTDMNAIRRDEALDALHSVYVDQWDWEKIIHIKERNLSYLKKIVTKIYHSLLQTQKKIHQVYPQLSSFLPSKIHFITTQELENRYPSLLPKEREYQICKQYQAVFLMQIGHSLNFSNQPHDLRAPDYDDWQLNGDLLIYYPILDCVIELSSMGIRVDKDSLLQQLQATNQTNKMTLMYHQMLIHQQLPLTIGGGIGQSRLCLLLLNKKHIGEVQASVWPKNMIEQCKKEGILLL